MAVAYDPAKQYEIKVWDVAYRHDPVRTLMARIYQPQGAGPFPALLDVHGGAWNDQDRTANAPVDERLAASGILVVAIDVRLAKEAPYPASVADANYGIRWLKSKASAWNGDPETLGALGSSSGGTCWNCAPCVRTIRVTRCIRYQRRHTSTRPWPTS